MVFGHPLGTRRWSLRWDSRHFPIFLIDSVDPSLYWYLLATQWLYTCVIHFGTFISRSLDVELIRSTLFWSPAGSFLEPPIETIQSIVLFQNTYERSRKWLLFCLFCVCVLLLLFFFWGGGICTKLDGLQGCPYYFLQALECSCLCRTLNTYISRLCYSFGNGEQKYPWLRSQSYHSSKYELFSNKLAWFNITELHF